MMLLTKEIKAKLPALYTNEEKKPEDIPVIVKFFAPWNNWTWYATEGEQQEDGDWMFFGLVDGHCKELGYFTLSQLEEVKGPVGLKIERDRSFSKMLSEVM